jgi:hypothetical protein
VGEKVIHGRERSVGFESKSGSGAMVFAPRSRIQLFQRGIDLAMPGFTLLANGGAHGMAGCLCTGVARAEVCMPISDAASGAKNIEMAP